MTRRFEPAALFLITLDFSCQIYRVQNPWLWTAWQNTKSILDLALLKEPEVALLFYGTEESSVKTICEKGFQLPPGKLAVRFCAIASDAHDDAKPCVGDGTRFVFAARVLIGKVSKLSAVSLPNFFKSYDTAVDSVKDPLIYVKQDLGDVYPAYLVQYSVFK